MALTITDEASANSTTSGGTLPLTVTAAVGALLLLVVAADNAGTAGAASLSSSAVSDSAGNVWVNRTLTNQTAGVVSDGTTLGVWTCMVSSALSAGTVTVAFSPNTTAKAAVIKKIVPAAGQMVVVSAVGTAAHGNGTTYAAPTVSVTSGDTIFGFYAVESSGASSDSDTTNGSWSTIFSSIANSGNTLTSQVAAIQSKTVNATGNQTYDPTVGAARDWAANYIILSPVTMTASSAGAGAASAAMTAVANFTATSSGTSDVEAIGVMARSVVARASGSSIVYVEFDGTVPAPGEARSLRILVQFDWMTAATARLWDGGGPWVDGDGNVWIGAGAFGDLDEIEQAINGEAATVDLTLSGVGGDGSGLVWLSYTEGEIVGSRVTIFIQSCDGNDQPIGSPEIRFRGTIDDFAMKDAVVDRRPVSTISVPVVNKFTVRRLSSGAVLSDADQRARSALLNPGAPPDRFCERVPLLNDKTITWPRWN